MLRPGKSNEKLQTRLMSGVEQPSGRDREDPHGVDAGFPHHREIPVHRRDLGKLRAVTALREGAVCHSSDEMLLLPGEEELAVHADLSRQIDSRRNLVDLDRLHGHQRPGRERAGRQSRPAGR